MDTQSLQQAVPVLLGLIAFFVYVYVGWIWPISKLQEDDKTKKSKTFHSMVLLVFGIGPILYILYMLWKARGSAVSPATGGNAPPPANVKPNLPSQAVGSEVPPANVKPNMASKGLEVAIVPSK